MANENINKVIFGSQTLIDLTGDTVSPEKLLKDQTAHDKSGAIITGTCPYDVDSTDATAAVGEILIGKTAYARGAKLTGTMPNNGSVNETIKAVNDEISIPMGFHDGSGKVSIDATEKAKITAGNIKQGVEILGIVGTCEPSSNVTAQSKTVTPAITAQTVLPDSTYDYLSQVIVNAIPYSESDNAAGGKTVTIGG